MATRSLIAQIDDNGVTVRAIYCHWDSYLEHNGRILQTHYESVRTRELISMGNLSSLQAEIGEAHPFNRLECGLNTEEWEAQYGNQCTFYGRDRGESNTEFCTYDSVAEMIHSARDCGAEFIYVLHGEEWFYSQRRYIEDSEGYKTRWTELQSLAPALEALEEKA